MRFDGIEPRTLGRQKASQDANAVTVLFDLAIVLSDPVYNLVTYMPGCIIPDHEKYSLASGLHLFTTVAQKLDRDLADGPAIHETQPNLFGHRFRISRTRG